MSYAWLFGLILGLVIATIAGLFQSSRKKEETDERTEAMRLQASSSSFYLLIGVAGLGWVYQIISSYLAGAEAPVVTPWSIMLAAALLIYLGTTLYQKWQGAVWSDLDAQERAQLQRKARTLLFGVGSLVVSSRLAQEKGAESVAIFLLALAAIGVLLGLFLMAKSRKAA